MKRENTDFRRFEKRRGDQATFEVYSQNYIEHNFLTLHDKIKLTVKPFVAYGVKEQFRNYAGASWSSAAKSN